MEAGCFFEVGESAKALRVQGDGIIQGNFPAGGDYFFLFRRGDIAQEAEGQVEFIGSGHSGIIDRDRRGQECGFEVFG